MNFENASPLGSVGRATIASAGDGAAMNASFWTTPPGAAICLGAAIRSSAIGAAGITGGAASIAMLFCGASSSRSIASASLSAVAAARFEVLASAPAATGARCVVVAAAALPLTSCFSSSTRPTSIGAGSGCATGFSASAVLTVLGGTPTGVIAVV